MITNQTGFPVLSRHIGDDFTTNTTLVWTDSWTNAYDWTNLGAASTWPASSDALNGHRTVLFDGANDYIKSLSYTSSPSHDAFMVIKLDPALWTVSETKWVWDSVTHTSRQFAQAQYANGKLAPSEFTAAAIPTNTWLILECSYIPQNGAWYTNNVAISSGHWADYNWIDGIIFGSRMVGDSFGKFTLAEHVSYGGGYAVPGTNTVARSNIVYSLKTKYGL